MQLKTRPSYWQNISTGIQSFPALTEDLQVDVLIVGGGISGVLIAWFLIEAGISVALIDRHQPGTGSTAASTGLLQYEIDTPLHELIKIVGKSDAIGAYQLGLRAIDTLEALCKELPEAVAFSRRKSIYFASVPEHREKLLREYEARQLSGFQVDFLDHSSLLKISSIEASAAIYSYQNAQINPLQFTLSLLELCCSRGLKVYGDSAVNEVKQGATTVTTCTTQGRVTSRQIVYATGYDSRPFLDQPKGSFHSTYVVCSKPTTEFQGWPAGSLIWETARPYFYARQCEEGRIIVGGEDTPYADDHLTQSLIEEKGSLLCNRFAKLFPSIRFEPDMTWAGTFGETSDGLAYIGRADAHSHELFCLGYGGNGITFSVIAGELLRDQILGIDAPAGRIFSFFR